MNTKSTKSKKESCKCGGCNGKGKVPHNDGLGVRTCNVCGGDGKK